MLPINSFDPNDPSLVCFMREIPDMIYAVEPQTNTHVLPSFYHEFIFAVFETGEYMRGLAVWRIDLEFEGPRHLSVFRGKKWRVTLTWQKRPNWIDVYECLLQNKYFPWRQMAGFHIEGAPIHAEGLGDYVPHPNLLPETLPDQPYHLRLKIINMSPNPLPRDTEMFWGCCPQCAYPRFMKSHMRPSVADGGSPCRVVSVCRVCEERGPDPRKKHVEVGERIRREIMRRHDAIDDQEAVYDDHHAVRTSLDLAAALMQYPQSVLR